MILRIVFAGLIAFSQFPQDQELVLLFEGGEVRHSPWIVQTKGTCEDGDCGWNATSIDKLSWRPPKVDVKMQIGDYELSESRGFERFQSIDDLVLGPAPVNLACWHNGATCPVGLRFWAPFAELEVCHYLHIATDCSENAGKRFSYNFAGKRNLVADAASLEVALSEDSITIVATEVGSDRVAKWAKLKPDYCGKITLVVSNLPVNKADNLCTPPERLEHFPSLYELLDLRRARQGRYSTIVPHAPKPEPNRACYHKDGTDCLGEQSCESEVACLAAGPATGDCVGLIPHGASECDMATIP